jgi:hypothetical protein
MENITQTITDSPMRKKTLPKHYLKRKKRLLKKGSPAKSRAEASKPKISVVLSTRPSEEFFSLGKKISEVATITAHKTLKSAVKTHITEVLIVPFF